MNLVQDPATKERRWTFEIAGQGYVVPVLSAVSQIHIARKLGPTVLRLLKGQGEDAARLKAIAASASGAGGLKLVDAADAIAPVIEALSNLDEGAVNYVLTTILKGAFYRTEGGGVLPILHKGEVVPRFTGLDVLAIVGQVLVAEFGGVVERLQGMGLTRTALAG